MKKVSVDAGRCSGCRLCELNCSFIKEAIFSPFLARITVRKEDNLGVDIPVVCWHCDPCSAMENCPTEALDRNAKGMVFVKEEKCIGCQECLEACILGAIKPHPENRAPLICDQCGGKPLCVEKCPTKALLYSDAEGQQPPLPSRLVKDLLRRWGMVA